MTNHFIKKALIIGVIMLAPFIVFGQELNLKYPVFRVDLNQVQNWGISGLVTWLYYGLLILSVGAALGILIYGGIEYMTSAGNPRKMKSGINRIQDVSIGILLIAISYLTLYTINPQLLSLEDSTLPELAAERDNYLLPDWPDFCFLFPEWCGDYNWDENIIIEDFGCNGAPYFHQCPPPWGSVVYGNCPSGYTICQAGCMPTSAAMVLSHYGVQINPLIASNFSVANGHRACTAGTYHSLFQDIASHYGMSYRAIGGSSTAIVDGIISELASGRPVIAAGSNYVFNPRSGRGHAIVFTCLEGNIIHINDSFFGIRTTSVSALYQNPPDYVAHVIYR